MTKTSLKTVAKAIPFVGLIVSVPFAAYNLCKGKPIAALGDLLSGAVSLIPGLGTGASVAISVGIGVTAEWIETVSKDDGALRKEA